MFTSQSIITFVAACFCMPFGVSALAAPIPDSLNAIEQSVQMPVEKTQVQGQQNDHPAWSFGCAEADVAIRAVPCDDPVYVYGGNCQMGSGRIDQPRSCNPKAEDAKSVAGKAPSAGTADTEDRRPWYNPLGFLFK